MERIRLGLQDVLITCPFSAHIKHREGASEVTTQCYKKCYNRKPRDNMDTFGEWLRQQRNQLKLTREQFAKRVGCSVALLRKIEDGERRPQPKSPN